MKNFLILLFICFLIFWAIAMAAPQPLFIFLNIYLALLISLICLIAYLGYVRGIIIGAGFICLPFLLEYFLNLFNAPFIVSPLIAYLSASHFNVPVTMANLITVFYIPAIFACSLIFSQKIRIHTTLKKYHAVFLTLAGSFLVALNFLNITSQRIEASIFFKWLILALLVNIILAKIVKFKAETPDFYKELPIIIYLLIFAANFSAGANYFFLIIDAILLIYYLIVLYNEHKFKKINQASPLAFS